MADPNTYDLDLPDDDGPPAPPPKPAKPAQSKTSPPPTDQGYELEEPIDEPAPTAGGSLLNDPRAAHLDGPEPTADDAEPDQAAPPPPPTPAAAPPGSGDRPKVSETLYKPEGDPAFIDPEVARMRREDQRRAAAEQLAIEVAAKKKRNLILGSIIAGIVVVLFVAWKLIF